MHFLLNSLAYLSYTSIWSLGLNPPHLVALKLYTEWMQRLDVGNTRCERGTDTLMMTMAEFAIETLFS